MRATEDPSSILCEHIDAKDSSGSWYQAFIISRDESKIRVHFNGWATKVSPLSLFSHPHSLVYFQHDEDIPAVDIATRTRPRGADTSLGGSGNETDEAVRTGATLSLYKYNMIALKDARCLHP